MKYKVLIGSLVLCFSAYSHAGCVGPVVNGNCLSETNVRGYDSGSDSRSGNGSGYDSNSGTRYEYDLSNPGDQVRYSTDLDAQRRDKMSLDTGRDLDRGLGQYGGGIYDD